jgi:hypothetical protein
VTIDDDARARAKELYARAPEGFIAARDALVGELREAGEPDLATAVKKLRKPSVVAWAVNGLAGSHRGDVEALLQVGEELRRAQQAALSGKGPSELRSATDERRAIIATLTSAATEALGERGGAHRDAIATTLEAASVDAEIGRRLLEGTLERESAPTPGLGDRDGFQLLEGGAKDEDGPSSAEREREAKDAERAAVAAEREAKRAGERAEKLRATARDAAAAANEAEADARRLADEARMQRRRADRAR